MKKKIIGLTIAGIVAVSGVVSAASMWGSYKGNDIVRMTVDGAPVKVSDVPAINYNNRTMIPINLLQQAGITYTWDAKNKTVDINKPKSRTEYVQVGIDYANIARHLKLYSVVSVGLNTTGDGIEAIIANTSTDSPAQEHYNEIYKTLAYSGAALVRVTYPNGSSELTQSKDLIDFFEYRITEDQLFSKMLVTPATNSSSSSSSSTSSTGSNTSSSSQGNCTDILNYWNSKGGIYSGGAQAALLAAGCSVPK